MKKLETKQQNLIQKREKSAAALLKEQPTLFTISPDYVLVISLFFIATVFMLHIVAKYSGGNNSIQVGIACVVVFVSVVYAIVSNRRK